MSLSTRVPLQTSLQGSQIHYDGSGRITTNKEKLEMKSKREIKREKVEAHNAAYIAEQERLSTLTPEERRRELISKGVDKALAEIKPQVNNLLNKP